MASIIDYAMQGSRIFLSSVKSRLAPKKYTGNDKEICHQVIKDCWNGRYFQTSTTNFPQFWTRDFGWCVQSLLKLGYEKEVQQTLRYAINRFKAENKITTTITPGGKPFDFPTMSVDSLPWLIHSIRLSHFDFHPFIPFLEKEIKKYFKQVISPNTGLVNPEKKFSSIKDFAVRKSSCYDNCMVGLLSQDLTKLRLYNPFKDYDYPDLIKRHFWNGKYFYDDLTKQDYVAGDANVFPFVLGMCTDKEMLQSALTAIADAELDVPLPLKYTAERKNVKFIWQEVFLKDYESDAIWTHLGPLYIRLLQQVNKEKALTLKNNYKKKIEKHKNYLEVFSAPGQPYRSAFYSSDRGMLWAANYLTL
ncbi:MAG: hypothetical protein Q8R37_05085 [Nanoarchaeota archaeon]|nr:hypothetical protein [Nanoarchaeota archaeon]